MPTQAAFTLHPAAGRGYARQRGLESWHSFSFADYYDPENTGFRSLRVLNDDLIAPGEGFPAHPHRDMEMVSYLLEGSLVQEDSRGNRRLLRPGEIQLMRAGSGILHSERNPSSDQPARQLQIWITPHTRGLDPSYAAWTRPCGRTVAPKTLVISPDGRGGSAVIAQDAFVHLLHLPPGSRIRHKLAPGRGLWLHIARGTAHIHRTTLSSGDALSLEEEGELEITTTNRPAEAILFDLG